MTHEADRIIPGAPGTPEGLSRPELEAAQWLVRLTSGEAGAIEQLEFRAWCRRAAQNRAAFKAAYRLWRTAGPALRAAPEARRQAWSLLAPAVALLLTLLLGYDPLGQRGLAEAGERAVLRLDASQGHCRLLLGAGEDSFDVTPTGTGAEASETQVRVPDAALSLRPYTAGVLLIVDYGRVQASDGRGMRLVASGQRMRCEEASRVAAVSAPGAERPWNIGGALSRAG